MKQLVLTLFLIFVMASPAFGQWGPIATKLEKSIVYVEMEGTEGKGACTGIVIDKDKVLTASHCFMATMLFAGHPGKKVLFRDTKLDLLVMEVENLDRPPAKFGKENPKIGDEIASYGFGYGLERPLFRVSHLSDDKTVILAEGYGGPVLAVDAAFVPGQSGGPVVNAAGEVVMIVQFGTDRVGLGRGVEVLHDKIGKFIASP